MEGGESSIDCTSSTVNITLKHTMNDLFQRMSQYRGSCTSLPAPTTTSDHAAHTHTHTTACSSSLSAPA